MRYRDKLRLAFVLVLALSVGFSGAWLISSSFDAARRREVDAALGEQRMALYALAAAAGPAGTPDIENMTAAMTSLAGQTEVSYRLTGEDGSTLFESENAVRFGGQYLQDAGEAPDTVVWRVCERGGRRCLEVTGAVEVGGRRFFLDSLREIEDIYTARDEQCRQFIGLMAAVGLVGFFVAGLLARRLTVPLVRLAETARAVTGGALDRRAEVSGGDEIGQLAADFNTMTERLSDNIRALEEAMNRQEEFMASFAHEMRTPMTSIIGYADLLRADRLPAGERAQAAQYIFTEGKRLESLSTKLLDLIVLGKQEFHGRPCRMARLVAEAGGLLDPQLRKSGVSLRCTVDDTVLSVEPDLVKTLLVNLLDNARKAMPDGGSIRLRGAAADGGWRLTIHDEGRGMPPEAIPRLTEAFYRVDKSRSRAQGGVGLGLCLCADIVKLHGGRMHFDSVLGEGTTVTVWLKGGNGDEV